MLSLDLRVQQHRRSHCVNRPGLCAEVRPLTLLCAFYTFIMFLNLLSGHATPGRGISYLGLELSIRNILNGPKEPLSCSCAMQVQRQATYFLLAGPVWFGEKNLFFGGLVGWFDLVLETGSWHMAQAGLQLGILLS